MYTLLLPPFIIKLLLADDFIPVELDNVGVFIPVELDNVGVLNQCQGLEHVSQLVLLGLTYAKIKL